MVYKNEIFTQVVTAQKTDRYPTELAKSLWNRSLAILYNPLINS